MTRIFSLIFCLVIYNSFCQQQAFVTTWTVFDNNSDIKIPTREDYTYNYTVDFGDGTVLINQTGDVVHNYASGGTYTVSITGVFPLFNGIELDTNTNSILGYPKLRTVEQWGDIQWLSMEDAFNSFHLLAINADDAPDLSQVTSMHGMFQYALDFNEPINHWDVSNITDMSDAFYYAKSFNQPLNNWDVSNVNNMSSMFEGAQDFNQNLNAWNVENVTTMADMFYAAVDFNQPLNNWDVTNVVDMSNMFRSSSFDQDLSNWNVANVNDMSGMFNGCYFNQPINDWDVSNVTHMNGTFAACPFNQPLDNWDVSNVVSMAGMFSSSAFNKPLNTWDVSNVTTISNMFRASQYNQPLDNWDVSSVTYMSFVFAYSSVFNQNLNTWDVSGVTDMSAMFYDTYSFNQPLHNWDVSNVDNFNNMFNQASSFNQDLSTWYFTDPSLYAFISETAMSPENYDLLLDRLDQLTFEDIDKNVGASYVYYCDWFTRKSLQDKGWILDDFGSSSTCSYNHILGSVIYDYDSDGCNSGDMALPEYMVNVSNGTSEIAITTDEDGDFSIRLLEGNYTLQLQNLSPNFTATPPIQTVNFNDTGNYSSNIDFCIEASQTFEDLAVHIIPLNDAIPGFETTYQITAYNHGSQTIPNTQVVFSYDSAFQSFVSSTQTATSSNSNALTFLINDLEPFSSEIIEVTLLNAIPPTLTGGEILNLSAEITPDTNDSNLKDNLFILDQEVINSFDPNDKLVVQGNEISEDNISEYLDYRIRFQNVGTAHALNVIITDTISNHLDWSTFQPISSSHDYRVELIDQEEINFIFENIYLPYEALDQEGSNGYVTFKIKPRSTVEIGDVIENTAYIYFDFNAPIITNTVSTSIVDKLSAVSFDKTEINLYPNPVQHKVYVETQSPSEILEKVEIYDLHGKLVFKKVFFSKNGIDVQFLDRGVYIIKINDNWVRKLIKE